MAIWLFTSAVLEGRPIEIFNHGAMYRDLKQIDDIVFAACSRAGPDHTTSGQIPRVS